jgi:hypothetical protein
MVVGDVLADYAFGMATVTDEHVIEAAAPNGSDHPLSERICLGRSGRRGEWTNTEATNAGAKRRSKHRVAVVDEESRDMPSIDGGLDETLGGPCGGRVLGNADVDQTTAFEGEHDEHVEHLKSGGDDGEEITGPGLVKVVAYERHPPLPASARQPRRPVLRHCAGRDNVAELGQLTADHVLVPGCVVTPHAADEVAKIHVDRRTATGPTRSTAPEQSPAGSVPPDDGLGPNDEDGGEKVAEPPGQGREQPSVEGAQARSLDLPAQDDDLLAQEQVLGDERGAWGHEGEHEVP